MLVSVWRRLGEAILEMLRGVMGLDMEVGTAEWTVTGWNGRPPRFDSGSESILRERCIYPAALSGGATPALCLRLAQHNKAFFTLQELHTPKGKGKGKGKKGKHWGKHAWHTMWTGCHATETAEEIGPAAKHDEPRTQDKILIHGFCGCQTSLKALLKAIKNTMPLI